MTTTTPPTPSVQLLEVTPEYAGQRIDNFLLARLKGVPKTLIYRILRKGEVRVNKGRIKPEYKLQAAILCACHPFGCLSAMSQCPWRKVCCSALKRPLSTKTRR